MSIYDRDYMRKESGNSGRSGNAEDQVEDFVRKNRRLLTVVGFVLAALIVAGLLMALFT